MRLAPLDVRRDLQTVETGRIIVEKHKIERARVEFGEGARDILGFGDLHLMPADTEGFAHDAAHH